jgi:uncharacterized membrane protein
MKKALLLLLVSFIAFTSTYAQNSEVETATQITKAEQFKKNNNFVKETIIYKANVEAIVMNALLLTNLTSGEKLTALDFSHLEEDDEEHEFLGYLDMDEVDDMIARMSLLKPMDFADIAAEVHYSRSTVSRRYHRLIKLI